MRWQLVTRARICAYVASVTSSADDDAAAAAAQFSRARRFTALSVTGIFDDFARTK